MVVKKKPQTKKNNKEPKLIPKSFGKILKVTKEVPEGTKKEIAVAINEENGSSEDRNFEEATDTKKKTKKGKKKEKISVNSIFKALMTYTFNLILFLVLCYFLLLYYLSYA
jgi:hypothetical protein